MIATSRGIYFLSFLLAFCSLIYEFVFAQILSITMGGTKTQYLITISIFTFALGLGSILNHYFKKKSDPKKTLFIVEIFLTFIGFVGPFFILFIMSLGNHDDLMPFKFFVSYFLIFIVGALSGFEVPCLINMGLGTNGKILAYDYLGMLSASLAFPFLILPKLGIAAGCIMISTLNGLAILFLTDVKSRKVNIVLYVLIICVLYSTFKYRDELSEFMSRTYIHRP
jgi:spermidine synthase